jgi:2-polyprenyl-3-methyl-5-hydroxy-6-metoxy-1,4-benzoquinol methylase
VFDVDGHVIGADELVERVEKLIATIDERDDRSAAFVRDRVAQDEHDDVGDPIMPMRALHNELYPPDLTDGPGARGRASSFTKRLVRKLTSWEVEPRWTVQQHYDGHNIHFAAGVVGELRRMDRELDELRRQNIRLKLQVVGSTERLNRYKSEVNRALDDIATNRDLHDFQKQLERLGATSSNGKGIDYAAFEDRCRGSSDEVRRIQEHYLTFFPPAEGTGKVLDIGCGRGEMLEILTQAGYDALGIDLNTAMVEICRAKNLPVVQDDGITFLDRAEDDSLRGIFCAQVVEHLLTSELERLLQLAHKKLLESGVLVIETINPRSLFALGNHFFADTTHVKPVHPETLRFMCEQVGFATVELEEQSAHPIMEIAEDLPQDQLGTVVDALVHNVFGNQDYVIVATK